MHQLFLINLYIAIHAACRFDLNTGNWNGISINSIFRSNGHRKFKSWLFLHTKWWGKKILFHHVLLHGWDTHLSVRRWWTVFGSGSPWWQFNTTASGKDTQESQWDTGNVKINTDIKPGIHARPKGGNYEYYITKRKKYISLDEKASH